MSNLNLPIEEYFTYHPPVSDVRKAAHAAINGAALEFARVVEQCVVDEPHRQFAVMAIQQARMFANLGVTVDELVADRERRLSDHHEECKIPSQVDPEAGVPTDEF